MRIDVDVVNQDLLIPPEDKYVVEGTQEFIQFHFKLKDGWEDLTVFAQFIQNSSAYNVYLDSDNNVYLPPEIENGFVQIVLYGTYDETIAISNFLRLRVRRTPFIADGQSVVITESLYDQMVTMVDDFESSINDAIDALSGEVGDLTNLTTTTKISIVAAINELKGRIDTNQTAIGTLSSLTTTNKSNLVAAVNEVKSKADEIGVLSSLTTDAKSSAVAAINEVNGKVIDIENAEGLHKYGVSGIGQSASALTRIWDSVGMTAQVGTDGDNSNVINNFDDVKPFNRRKCVGTWELINGRPVFEVEAYLGDDDYTEDGTKGDYVAVECPKAYYYLKNGTLGISAHQWDSDWKPFDIFCHDHDPHQVMDYVYLPAYALAVKNGHAVSLPNLPNEQGHYQGLTNSARTYNGAVGAKAILHNLLACSGIAEGSYNQVILLRHHHEFHALLPVTKTVELEILTDEVCWSILICLTSCLIDCCLLSLNSFLLGSTGLHDVGVHLCRDCHHQHGESHCQNRSFHYHGFINCTISSAKIKKIFDTCAKMT